MSSLTSSPTPAVALIVGAGRGLSAALARIAAGDGMKVALAARTPDDLADLAAETGARTYACDAGDPDAVEALFAAVDSDLGSPRLVVYNPSYRVRGAFVDLDPREVERTLRVTAFGGFLVAQQAASRMLAAGQGTILFTGASASVKGYAQSAPFAMGKFALRGLAQSLARELHPKNIHIGHIVIDGAIADAARGRAAEDDNMLDSDAVARAYFDLHRQHRSAWAWEIEVRPWGETF